MVDREQRTPFYGIVLILAAMFGAFAVNYYAFGAYWFRIAVYVVAAAVVAVGFVMTFRDYSH
ncbi:MULTISPECIES: hypothetical protein [Rhodococcus]|uniref:Uncharacterized protein n=1 Tax=Rhodococcus gannanensis TaxID=1960308 RepID=A0ABW4PBQ9_9NOCA|nr:hypothetical protein G419_17372 [Rhodococcus triatomae BKS 15-14]